MKKRVTLSVDSEVYDNFQKYCEENAIMLSKKVELMMKSAMENGDGAQKEVKNGEEKEEKH